MKWWWSPWRKRAWLRAEQTYRAARWDAWSATVRDPLSPLSSLDHLKPEGWTREIEMRRWNSWRPQMRRWTA